jgi:hypothetical protein
VYELSQDSTQVGDECPICFDEFEEGKKKGCINRYTE